MDSTVAYQATAAITCISLFTYFNSWCCNSITELSTCSNSSASQFEKRTKKKTKRTRGKKDLNTGMTEVMDNQETTPMNYEDQTTNAVTIQNRTLSNGLVIEELASGPPDGKVARPGKRVCTPLLTYINVFVIVSCYWIGEPRIRLSFSTLACWRRRGLFLTQTLVKLCSSSV